MLSDEDSPNKTKAEQGVALNTCPAASSIRHDNSTLNSLSKTRRRAGVRGLRRSAEMIYVDRDIPDEDLIRIVRDWIDILSHQRFNEFFDALGYSMGGQAATAEWIKADLSRYRSDLYPGITYFEVTDWRAAQGGYPDPREEIVWYESNESRLAGAVKFTLPLNGMWSDASADFILIETNSPEGLLLRLEEISIPIRSEQEAEQVSASDGDKPSI